MLYRLGTQLWWLWKLVKTPAQWWPTVINAQYELRWIQCTVFIELDLVNQSMYCKRILNIRSNLIWSICRRCLHWNHCYGRIWSDEYRRGQVVVHRATVIMSMEPVKAPAMESTQTVQQRQAHLPARIRHRYRSARSAAAPPQLQTRSMRSANIYCPTHRSL